MVQAVTWDVFECILEAWLAYKGSVFGPSASASDVSKEMRERHQRLLKRQLQRKQAQELARPLTRQRGSKCLDRGLLMMMCVLV